MSNWAEIANETDYKKLLVTGMFFEFYPQLTGVWENDKVIILNRIIEDKVEEWHQGKTDLTLQAYLDMTDEEYGRFLRCEGEFE